MNKQNEASEIIVMINNNEIVNDGDHAEECYNISVSDERGTYNLSGPLYLKDCVIRSMHELISKNLSAQDVADKAEEESWRSIVVGGTDY